MPEQLILAADGRIVAHPLVRADTWAARRRGLSGKRALDGDEVLMLEPATPIHTGGMRVPLDVVFCDRDLRVLRVVGSMRPGRVTRWAPRARCVFELRAGAARGIEIGDRLIVSRVGDTSDGSRREVSRNAFRR